MADSKITDLNIASSPLANNLPIVVVEGGETKQSTTGEIVNALDILLLSNAGALTGAETVLVNQGGANVKTTTQDIKDFVGVDTKVITSINSNYTILSTDDVLLVDVSSNPVTITLQAASTRQTKRITIKHIAGNIKNNPITVSAPGGDSVENDSDLIFKINEFSITLQSDGANDHYII